MKIFRISLLLLACMTVSASAWDDGCGRVRVVEYECRPSIRYESRGYDYRYEQRIRDAERRAYEAERALRYSYREPCRSVVYQPVYQPVYTPVVYTPVVSYPVSPSLNISWSFGSGCNTRPVVYRSHCR